jgi:hypothetical protein
MRRREEGVVGWSMVEEVRDGKLKKLARAEQVTL